ncbi:mitotic spindle checkpoint protein Bub3 [Tritrichomonas musculus]|uniref:Mitotic spindle checkpoint protein Bub3 n=1 Tax=Tritrichomonas musculus TaxID=1915356 RepID=A0ABR2K766_9EUKA
MSTYEIPVPLDEGISTVHFCPNNQKIISMTTWSGAIHLYDIESKEQIFNSTFNSPLICSTFVDDNSGNDFSTIAVGDTEGSIYLINSSSSTTLKWHTDGISSLSIFPETGLLLSSSWDKTLALWNTSQSPETSLIGHIDFNEKLMFASACSENRIVAYGHRNTVFVLDVRNPDHIERRVSSLGKQIRSFCISAPDHFGWAIGSIDGRVAIEYFGDIKHQAQRFSFSCNRHEEEEKTIVYPVSCLAFHPVTGILTSGSSKGSIYFWDIQNKRKLTEVQSPFNNSVAAIDYNKDGTLLAIAYSYTWEKGDIEHPEDRVLIYTPTAQNISLSHPAEK